jgi:hypothetical protein
MGKEHRMNGRIVLLTLALDLYLDIRNGAQQLPTRFEGDFTIRDFRFESGESLPELKATLPHTRNPRP